MDTEKITSIYKMIGFYNSEIRYMETKLKELYAELEETLGKDVVDVQDCIE